MRGALGIVRLDEPISQAGDDYSTLNRGTLYLLYLFLDCLRRSFCPD